MKMRLLVVMVLVFGLLVAVAGTAAAQGFSADIVSQYGKESTKGKVYISKDKMRFETGSTFTITRMDTKVIWMVMPSEKMYMERGFSLDHVIPSSEPMQDEVERILLGTETVNGVVANKYRVTLKSNRQQESLLIWLAADSGIPVRMAAMDGNWWQEYRNIRIGEPDPALFEIPSGYNKFSMSL